MRVSFELFTFEVGTQLGVFHAHLAEGAAEAQKAFTKLNVDEGLIWIHVMVPIEMQKRLGEKALENVADIVRDANADVSAVTIVPVDHEYSEKELAEYTKSICDHINKIVHNALKNAH